MKNLVHIIVFLGSMLATSGAFTSRRLQRQAMRAGRRVGGGTGGGARNTTGRVRALRRTRSAQVYNCNESVGIVNSTVKYEAVVT